VISAAVVPSPVSGPKNAASALSTWPMAARARAVPASVIRSRLARVSAGSVSRSMSPLGCSPGRDREAVLAWRGAFSVAGHAAA
jgi:hypothetical protein